MHISSDEEKERESGKMPSDNPYWKFIRYTKQAVKILLTLRTNRNRTFSINAIKY